MARPGGGLKIGMTSGASRNAMGDGIRPFGFILKSRIGLDNMKLNLKNFTMVESKTKFFKFNSSLSAGTTIEDAKLKVASIHPGFEINQALTKHCQ